MRLITTQAMLFLAAVLVLSCAKNVQAQRGNFSDQQGGFQGGGPTVGPAQGQRQPGQRQQGQGRQNQRAIGQQQGQRNSFGQQRPGGQDGFVGSDARQIRNQRNQRNANQRRRSNINSAIESLNDMRQSQGQRGNRQSQRSPVRVQIRPRFAVRQPLPAELGTRVRTQMSRALPASAATTSISITGSTATIVGTVPSDYDKRLAAKMLSLQPGILQVENELRVVPNPTAP